MVRKVIVDIESGVRIGLLTPVRLREPINWQEFSVQLSDISIYRKRYSPPTAFAVDAMKEEQCSAEHQPYYIATHALTQVFSMVLRLSDGMLTFYVRARWAQPFLDGFTRRSHQSRRRQPSFHANLTSEEVK